MKTILSLLALVIPFQVWSQPTDPFAAFSAQKKTIALRTGITLRYIDAGNPAGTAVILLHGCTDSGRSFQFTIEEMLKRDAQLRILAPDLRGHGGSSMPDSNLCREAPEKCFSPADFASDIVALMDSLHIAKAHVVGHSMGSIVAQELVVNHAGRINHVVLIGTFANGKASPAINQFLIADLLEASWRPLLEKRAGFRWPADAYLLTPEDLGGEVRDFLKTYWVADPIAREDFVSAVLPETMRTPLGVWIGALRALAETDNRRLIKNVKKPTLILWATQDNFFPEHPDQQSVKDAFAEAAETNGTRVFYKTYGQAPLPASGLQETDLGHNLHWGCPGEVAADIVAFIRKGEPEYGLPYANPADYKEVKIDPTGFNITVWGRNADLKK